MKRSRSLRSIPTAGGKTCSQKALSEVLPCSLGACRFECVDGEWGDWDSWSPCSRTCGGGETFRRRQVALMANSCGNPAQGMGKEIRFCNADVPCHAAKDCLLTPWSSWNSCSSSCDGVSMRYREVAEFGHGDGSFCSGALKEIMPCNPAAETNELNKCIRGPPVDCQLQPWEDWTQCTATCGGGERQRSRQIAREAFNGGFGCQEPLAEVLECARDLCHQAHDPVDCVLGEWRSWGTCTACGGERTRVRNILVFPKNGGQECPAADEVETTECPQNCGTQVACSWTLWGSWGECSMSCGVGARRKRIRRLNKIVTPIDYGKPLQSLHRWDLLQEYSSLHKQARLSESRHVQEIKEIILSFGAGCACMLILLGIVMRSVSGRHVTVEDGPHCDMEDPLVPS